LDLFESKWVYEYKMFVLSEHIYIISSYFIFVEPFWHRQIQKKGLIEKKLAISLDIISIDKKGLDIDNIVIWTVFLFLIANNSYNFNSK